MFQFVSISQLCKNFKSLKFSKFVRAYTNVLSRGMVTLTCMKSKYNLQCQLVSVRANMYKLAGRLAYAFSDVRQLHHILLPAIVVHFGSMVSQIEEKSSVKSFSGFQKTFSHDSSETKTKMTFAVYLPPKAEKEKCPVLFWLSGLTCTEQNFITKGGFQRLASELGIIVVCPDTSPRGCNIDGEDESYDFGSGAGFYVDATEDKWKTNYRMYSYVTKELVSVVENNFPVAKGQYSIFGHSMGGHGALVCGLKNPGMYKSISAFSPICNPMNCPWGQKALSGYLGGDKDSWKAYDACELASSYTGPKVEILCDQGTEDNFLKQNQLLPDNLVKACSSNNNIGLVSRMQEGYDHSYYFISTFVEDHLRFHAKALGC